MTTIYTQLISININHTYRAHHMLDTTQVHNAKVNGGYEVGTAMTLINHTKDSVLPRGMIISSTSDVITKGEMPTRECADSSQVIDRALLHANPAHKCLNGRAETRSDHLGDNRGGAKK